MVREPHKLFRRLTFICLAIIVIFSVFYYFGFADEKIFAILSGVVAILAGAFGIFASKPIGKEDVSVAIDKVLLTYDTETLVRLQKAKEEQKEILDFIENRSNQVFLLKLRVYLQDAVEKEYAGSEIEKLIKELEGVEAQLDAMHIKYGPIELPARFKKLLNELNVQEREKLYLDTLDAMVDTMPFFPFKQLYKAYTHLIYYDRNRRRGLWK